MSKYYNIKSHGFDSKKEERRFAELRLLERAGAISNLQRQVTIELIPSQYIGKKCVERAVKYIADFTYEENGNYIVEDVKSPITRKNKDYIIKRKLLLYVHGIQLRET